MARLPRAVLPGQVHLVVQRGHSGQRVFFDSQDRDNYLAALRESAAEAKVVVHAYGLPDSEVRLLATPSTADGLAAMLQGTGRRYVRLFNRLHQRSGSPWDGRFRSSIVEPESHFAACLRFVETDDALAGSAASLSNSSAPHHLGLARSALLAEHPAYWAMGNTPFEREAAHRRSLQKELAEDEVAAILRALKSGWILGTSEFAKSVEAQTNRRSEPLKAGRPKKSMGGSQ